MIGASGRFENRSTAGKALGEALAEYAGREDVIVLALPRGGVPVGIEVAEALGATFDVLVVRKLGTPGQPELAMGAIASGGMQVLNKRVIEEAAVSERQLQAEIARQQEELARREQAFRGARPFPEVQDKTVIVVDDGLATGATMRVAVRALRAADPQEIIVAVPVAPPHIQDSTLREADRFIALAQPAPFYAVGMWYRDFDQTTDQEVAQVMSRSRQQSTGVHAR